MFVYVRVLVCLYFFCFLFYYYFCFFFFSSRRRHTRSYGDWSSDVCSSDLSSARRRHSRTLLSRAKSRRVRSSSSAGRDHRQVSIGEAPRCVVDRMESWALAHDLASAAVVCIPVQVWDPRGINALKQPPRSFRGPSGACAVLQVPHHLRRLEVDHLDAGPIREHEGEAVEVKRKDGPFRVAPKSIPHRAAGQREVAAGPREQVGQRAAVGGVPDRFVES